MAKQLTEKEKEEQEYMRKKYPDWNKKWGTTPKLVDKTLAPVISGIPQQWWIVARELAVKKAPKADALEAAGMSKVNPSKRIALLMKRTDFAKVYHSLNQVDNLEISRQESRMYCDFENFDENEFAANYARIFIKVEKGELDLETAKELRQIQKQAEEVRGMHGKKGGGTVNVNGNINTINVDKMTDDEINEALRKVTEEMTRMEKKGEQKAKEINSRPIE